MLRGNYRRASCGNAPKVEGTMDRQMHELTLLSLLAVLGTMLASMREDQLFTAVFAAEAGFAFASLVRRLN